MFSWSPPAHAFCSNTPAGSSVSDALASKPLAWSSSAMISASCREVAGNSKFPSRMQGLLAFSYRLLVW